MNNLEKLLETPLHVIVGAGGSMDYGFPSWEALNTEFIDELNYWKKHGSGHLSVDPKKLETAIDYWLIELGRENNDRTVDDIAAGASLEGQLLFQWIIQKIVMKYEQADPINERKWIELFCDALLEIALQKKYEFQRNRKLPNLPCFNLNLYTLNYDRCFIHRMYEYFYKPLHQKFDTYFGLLGQPHWNNTNSDWRRVRSMHGTIATYTPNDSQSSLHIFSHASGTPVQNSNFRAAKYGALQLKQGVGPSERSSIVPVGLNTFGYDHFATGSMYVSVNKAILKNETSNFLLIGISKLGWLNSGFRVPKIMRKIYSTGNDNFDGQVIATQKYAKEFVTEFLLSEDHSLLD